MNTFTQRMIDNARGKWIKAALTDIETIGLSDKYLRKIILDNMNELVREILIIIASETQETITFRYTKDTTHDS